MKSVIINADSVLINHYWSFFFTFIIYIFAVDRCRKDWQYNGLVRKLFIDFFDKFKSTVKLGYAGFDNDSYRYYWTPNYICNLQHLK
jgi:translation elongation factor EF-4